MVPKGARRTSEFADAVKLEVDGNFAKALPILSKPSLQQGPLGDYAQYYQAFAEMRLGRPAEARRLFQALQSKSPVGYLVEGAALREAECDEALGDQAAALEVYERLAREQDDGARRSADAPGTRRRAVGRTDRADRGVHRASSTSFRSAISRRSPAPSSRVAAGRRRSPRAPTATGWSWDAPSGCSAPSATRRRARRSRRCGRVADGDDRELVQLRLAECDYFLKRRAQRARRRAGRTSTRRRGRARRCSSMRSPRASSATTPNTCASSAASSTSSRRRAGPKRR